MMCLSDPYAVLTTIDLQFMTCTQSITRIGETHPTSNHQPPNASSVKVELYYENDDSIIPLPPFLASYSSSKTRTTYDTLPSLVSITRMEHWSYCCSDFLLVDSSFDVLYGVVAFKQAHTVYTKKN